MLPNVYTCCVQMASWILQLFVLLMLLLSCHPSPIFQYKNIFISLIFWEPLNYCEEKISMGWKSWNTSDLSKIIVWMWVCI